MRLIKAGFRLSIILKPSFADIFARKFFCEEKYFEKFRSKQQEYNIRLDVCSPGLYDCALIVIKHPLLERDQSKVLQY